jgi:hypothetical protein
MDAAMEHILDVGSTISKWTVRPVLGDPMPPKEKHIKEEVLHKLSSHGKWHPRRLVLTSEVLAFSVDGGDVMIECIPLLEIAAGSYTSSIRNERQHRACV